MGTAGLTSTTPETPRIAPSTGGGTAPARPAAGPAPPSLDRGPPALRNAALAGCAPPPQVAVDLVTVPRARRCTAFDNEFILIYQWPILLRRCVAWTRPTPPAS